MEKDADVAGATRMRGMTSAPARVRANMGTLSGEDMGMDESELGLERVCNGGQDGHRWRVTMRLGVTRTRRPMRAGRRWATTSATKV